MTNRLLLGLSVMLLAGMGTFVGVSPKNLRFGVVDTSFIVAEQAKILAKNNPNTNLTPQRIRQITDNLKEQVDVFCHQKNIILISKGAVWGGDLQDYTQEIYGNLNLEGNQE